MLNTININLKTDIKTDSPTSLPITLMSQDVNNNQFILKFTSDGESVALDSTYTVEILTKFTKSGVSRLTSATVRQDYATWEFDTAYITQDETVYNYVYVRKSGSLVVSADANCFVFSVGLSEIDKDAGRIAEVYDENYEKYLDEFKENVNFEEIAQAEQARKEAEILRQESYDTKVDTAIVEADVVEKVDNKVTELAPQINSLTAQLAQTKTEPFSRLSSETNNVVSFYFDDGSANDYSIVLPIAQKYDIPISIAALPRQNGGQYLTDAQLVELQNVHGWEIGSHTYNHVNSPTLSEEDLNHDYALSKEILKGLGLNITHLCYPFGYYDEKSMKVAKNHYDFALSSDQFSNKSPVRTYSINRIFMPNYTTAQLKAMVDDMRNEWYIFYGHSHDMDFPQSERIKLDDLISYVKSKNIPIENVTPAFEMFKNIVDVGYQYKDNKFFQVGADGEVAYADGIYKFLGVNPEITVDTPYTDFEIGKISVGVFTNVTNGFPFGVSPNGALGTVYTYRHARHNPSVYQKFELYNGTEVGYRTLSGGAWTDFVKYKPSVKVPIASEITDDTPVDYFSAGSTTIFNISQNQAPNFRGGEPGTLTVSTLGSLALRHQKWHKYNTREQYIRYWISGSNSWGAWLSLGEKKHTITTAMGTIAPNANLTFLLDVPEVKFASSFVTNFTSNLPTGVTFDFSVSAENVIRLRMSNLTAQSVDLGTRAVHILVF